MHRTPIPGSIGSPQRSRMRSVAETNSPTDEEAPKDVAGHREEIYEKVQAEKLPR